MGTYNELLANCSCPHCGVKQDFVIQYRHGDCWMYRYKMGDSISWGGNVYFDGEKIYPGSVLMDKNPALIITVGLGSTCPSCGAESPRFAITINDNVLSAVEPEVK